MMWLIHTVCALICMMLAIHYMNTGDVAKVVFYCFLLHWYLVWKEKEDEG